MTARVIALTALEQRARERVIAAGLRPERTVEEWVAHPRALEDLLRIMGGTSHCTIWAEREHDDTLIAELVQRALPYLPKDMPRDQIERMARSRLTEDLRAQLLALRAG